MGATDAILSTLERNWTMVDSALEGMDDATLARLPNAHSNSIAWTLWHMSRVVDTFILSRLQSRPQVWISGGWCGRCGMAADPDERGVGWTAEQMAAWAVPPAEALLGYFEATKAGAREYISSLSNPDLEERKVIPPAAEPRTVAEALGQMVWDNVAHGGQIAYLRGFFQGMGWHV